MRIIAGKARGRKLIPPATMETRPTLDRVKEAMFSTIQNHLLDAIVIDVFAGTGSLGLEAASRGAKEVYLVDKSAVTFPLLKENVMVELSKDDETQLQFVIEDIVKMKKEKRIEKQKLFRCGLSWPTLLNI